MWRSRESRVRYETIGAKPVWARIEARHWGMENCGVVGESEKAWKLTKGKSQKYSSDM